MAESRMSSWGSCLPSLFLWMKEITKVYLKDEIYVEFVQIYTLFNEENLSDFLKLHLNPKQIIFDTSKELFSIANARHFEISLFRTNMINWRFPFHDKGNEFFRNLSKKWSFKLNFILRHSRTPSWWYFCAPVIS